MTTPTAPVVLLIPGFFGYNAFGPDNAPLLEYFAGVREVLQPNLPANYRVLVHEPPPTGSLDERVASLHDTVRKLRQGEKVPHARETVRAAPVHLVGHSTGGVDARLLGNPKYFWKGGPRGSERTEVIASIGQIVSLSAPFHGTPLVSHARLVRDMVLDGVQLLTLLGLARSKELDSLVLQWLTAGAGSLARSPLSGGMPSAVLAQAARRGLPPGVSSADGDLVATQVKAFLEKIQEDRQLFDDLSTDNMAAINASIAGGDDLARIHSYVSVSPKPPIIDIGLDPLGRIVYETLYRMTARDALPAGAPTGKLIGPQGEIPGLLASDVSCDGVIPTRSQTLNANGAGIVLGDHLDVVGSFRGGSGADVMRSHSNFDKQRFGAVWADIAKHL